MVACPVQPKGYEVSSCFRPCEAIRPVLTWFLSRCINTWADLESCGGCPGSLKEDGAPLGVDCTALPNVDVVSCVEGTCAIGTSTKKVIETSTIADGTIGTCACLLFRILRRRIRLHTGQSYLRCEMIWEKPGIEYKLRRLEQVGVGLMDNR
jgi:hypothetical protein